MGFRRIVVVLFLQLRLWFASGPSCQSLGWIFFQGLGSQISGYLVALSLRNTVIDLFLAWYLWVEWVTILSMDVLMAEVMVQHGLSSLR